MTTNKVRKIVGRYATNTTVHRRIKGFAKRYSSRVNRRLANARSGDAEG